MRLAPEDYKQLRERYFDAMGGVAKDAAPCPTSKSITLSFAVDPEVTSSRTS